MKGLLRFSRAVDAFNRYSAGSSPGRSWRLCWSVHVNAIVRKVFNTSSNSWLEIQWVLFGAVFLLCSAWTLLVQRAHPHRHREQRFPKRVRDWIDVFGHVFFLIPVAFVMFYLSWPFFWRSLLQNEQSTNAGGLPVYPSKLLIPLAFTFLLLQGFSELIKRIAIISGELEDTVSGGGHHAAAEAEAQRVIQAAKEEAEKRARTSEPGTPRTSSPHLIRRSI